MVANNEWMLTRLGAGFLKVGICIDDETWKKISTTEFLYMRANLFNCEADPLKFLSAKDDLETLYVVGTIRSFCLQINNVRLAFLFPRSCRSKESLERFMKSGSLPLSGGR